MSEFVNRVDAQRAILAAVNERSWNEELLGLSSEAIHRWTESNRIDATSDINKLLRSLSERLAFLANKSQEHLSEEYLRGSADVLQMTAALRASLNTVTTRGQ
jgi:hypothetical protein